MSDKTLQQLDEQDIDIEAILPYGGMIQSVVAGSQLSKADLKRMLAMRGVFLSSSEKEDTVPILMSFLFTPREFEFLREQQQTKEETPKSLVRTIPCENGNFNLIEFVDQLKFPSDIVPQYSVFKVLESPSFVPKDNGLEMEFKIQRRNRTKDWAHNKSTHIGIIRLEKTGSDIVVTLNYTSPETKELNDKLFHHVQSKLKEKGLVKQNTKAKLIKYGDFINSNRIKFLLSLTSASGALFSFSQITDMDIGPDHNETLPESIDWIKQVKSMLLKGERLQLTKLLTDNTYHPSLIIESIEAEYKFTYNGSSGVCKIDYGFPGCLSSKTPSGIEFEAKVKSFNFNSGVATQLKTNTQRFLQTSFNREKATNYQEILSTPVDSIN